MSSVFYKAIGAEIDVFKNAHAAKIPMLLKGPTGCGKTRFVEYMAENLGLQLITVACNEDTSATDLIGRFLIKGGETVWIDGPIVRAMRLGAILYLDEIAEARPDAIVVIHSLTDHRREIFIDRTGENIAAPSQFMVVASYNPEYQRSMRELKQSTRQRFVGLSFSYPKSEIEIEIVEKEGLVEPKVARALVSLAAKIRGTNDLSLMETVSTRLLISAAKLIAQGVSPRLACKVAIVQPLTDDSDAIAALNSIVELSV